MGGLEAKCGHLTQMANTETSPLGALEEHALDCIGKGHSRACATGDVYVDVEGQAGDDTAGIAGVAARTQRIDFIF